MPSRTWCIRPTHHPCLPLQPIRGKITLGDRYDAVLRAARRGDDAAWAEIYRDLAGPVLGYLRAQRAPDPDDLLGETMLQVVRDLRRFEGDEAGFRSWVLTIAHRRLLDARRSNSRKPADAHETTVLEAALPAVDGAEPQALAELELDAVLAVLDRITDDQREVLVLRLVGDLDVAQTAEATGRSADAVKALSKRGLDRLRVLLGERTREDRPSPAQAEGRSHG
jgi:RNA polymerase sigma factor (sigma-70 family)